METNIIFFFIVSIIIAIIIGIFIGVLGAKFKHILFERKIVKNGKKVIDGKMDNKTPNADGKIIDVNKFVMRNDKGEEERISFGDIKVEKEEHNERKKKIIGNIPAE